nr:reverse transcriptase domain-containing protein [Tanacetum cinerariifolium]
MAALRYKDEHNKVGYLLKPTGSDDYHQTIDFLSASHIRAPELCPPAILATIDKTPYTITADLVRSRLQLADDGGITDLPIAEYIMEWIILAMSLKESLPFSKTSFHLNGGEGAEVAAQAVPQPMTTPAQSPAHLPTPSRPQPSDPIAPIHLWEAISIPLHQGPLMLPLHVNLREDHKKHFKDVVGKLVKKVKKMKVKLKTKKRKLVVIVTVDSDISSGSSSQIPAASPSVPTAGPPGTFSVPPAPSAVPPSPFDVPTGALIVHTGVLSKGKSPMVEEDIPVRARTFKQMEEDRLGEEAAKRLHDEEMAQIERERADV